MFGLGGLKLRSPEGEKTQDKAVLDDYSSSPVVGRVRFGKLNFYYRDLGKKYYVPYEYIDRYFERVSECQPDDSPAFYYYRLILVHGEKEFANLIFNEEKEIDAVMAFLRDEHPELKNLYIPPKDGKRRYFC